MISFTIKNRATKTRWSRKTIFKSYTIITTDDGDIKDNKIIANGNKFKFHMPFSTIISDKYSSVVYRDFGMNSHSNADVVTALFALTRASDESVEKILSRYKYYSKYYIEKSNYRKDIYIEVFADKDLERCILRLEWDDLEDKWFVTFEKKSTYPTTIYRFYLNKAWVRMGTRDALLKRAKMLAVILNGSSKFIFDGIVYSPNIVKDHKELLEAQRKAEYKLKHPIILNPHPTLKERQLKEKELRQKALDTSRRKTEQIRNDFVQSLEDVIPEFLTPQERSRIIHRAGEVYGPNDQSKFPIKVRECILYQNYDNPFKINDCIQLAIDRYKGYLKGPYAVNHFINTDEREAIKKKFFIQSCKQYGVYPPNNDLKKEFAEKTDKIDSYIESRMNTLLAELTNKRSSSAPTYDVEYDDDELFKDHEMDETDIRYDYYSSERFNIYNEFYLAECPYSWSDDYAISRYIPDEDE